MHSRARSNSHGSLKVAQRQASGRRRVWAFLPPGVRLHIVLNGIGVVHYSRRAAASTAKIRQPASARATLNKGECIMAKTSTRRAEQKRPTGQQMLSDMEPETPPPPPNQGEVSHAG